MADGVVTIGLDDLEPLAALVVAPVYMFGRPIDFTVIDANETASRALDVKGGTAVGRSISDFVTRHRPAGILGLYAQVVTTGQPVHHRGLAIYDSSDRLRHVWDGVLVPYGASVLGVFHDVTDDWREDREAADALATTTLLRERDRLARDLHDTVLQDVIAASMVLARLASTTPEATSDEIQRIIDIQDSAIAQLRLTLYDLRRRDRSDLRRQVLDVIDAAIPALGLAPLVTIPAVLPRSDHVAHHLLAILTEVLANVARHANATHVTVDLRVTDGHLVLTVTDNGAGIDPGAPPGMGLANMQRRAQLAGGRCDVTSSPGAGTTVECRVPNPSRHPHRLHDPRGADALS